MKQELTIAFGLLAAGAALVGWYSSDAPSGSGEHQLHALAADFLGVQDPVHASNQSPVGAVSEQTTTGELSSYAVQQASYFSAADDSPAQAYVLGRPRQVSDFRFDGTTADRAHLMLKRARHMIGDGPGFESNVNVRANFFGQTVIGSGRYLQSGQGMGKTRTSLAFHSASLDPSSKQPQQASNQPLQQPHTPPHQKVMNLCDGRFVYRLHEDLIEEQQTLEFYDLQQIKNSKSRHQQEPVTRQPAIPLAPGELMSSGMAGLLQHLADEFRFAIVSETEHPSGRVRLLRGTWHPSRLQNLLRDQLSPEQIDAGLAWSQLPPNLPHAVEVSLVRTSSRESTWELYPAQLTFYQFRSHKDRTLAQPVVVIQFEQPEEVLDVPADQFVLRSENLEATDLTQQYLSKLRPSDANSLR